MPMFKNEHRCSICSFNTMTCSNPVTVYGLKNENQCSCNLNTITVACSRMNIMRILIPLQLHGCSNIGAMMFQSRTPVFKVQTASSPSSSWTASSEIRIVIKDYWWASWCYFLFFRRKLSLLRSHSEGLQGSSKKCCPLERIRRTYWNASYAKYFFVFLLGKMKSQHPVVGWCAWFLGIGNKVNAGAGRRSIMTLEMTLKYAGRVQAEHLPRTNSG